jgi:hypothetical protein
MIVTVKRTIRISIDDEKRLTSQLEMGAKRPGWPVDLGQMATSGLEEWDQRKVLDNKSLRLTDRVETTARAREERLARPSEPLSIVCVTSVTIRGLLGAG